MHATANGRQEAALRRSMGPMPVRRQVVIVSGDVRKVVGEPRLTGLSIKTAEKMEYVRRARGQDSRRPKDGDNARTRSPVIS